MDSACWHLRRLPGNDMKRSRMKTLKSGLILLATGCMIWMTLTACSGSGKGGKSDPVLFYVGSGDREQEYSIFLCALDPVNLAFSVLDSFAGAPGSGYLDLSPDGKTLFAISSESIPGDEGNSSVASFSVNPADHSLELINRQSSRGSGICHVQAGPGGDYVFAAHYNSGHVSVLPVSGDGRIGTATSVVRGEGSGPVESRQEGPHAHQVNMDPSGKFLLVPDLGTDKVMNYLFDSKSGSLTPNPAQSFLKMEPGTGPRHLAFHPSGKYVYVLGELSATVTACRFESSTGKLELINSASIVEDGFAGIKQSAAVRVHPDGRYIYASNRSDVSNLAVFEKQEDGSIRQIQIIRDIPYWPRDFNISPDGMFLVVAGARVHEIELLEVDPRSGRLSKTGVMERLPSPICILFVH